MPPTCAPHGPGTTEPSCSSTAATCSRARSSRTSPRARSSSPRYNALGYAAAAIGNHEFDFGPAGPASTPQRPDDDPRGALKARAAQASFPFLAANLIDLATDRPVDYQNVKSSTVVTAAGVRGRHRRRHDDSRALFTTIAANVRRPWVAPLAETIEAEAKRLRARRRRRHRRGRARRRFVHGVLEPARPIVLRPDRTRSSRSRRRCRMGSSTSSWPATRTCRWATRFRTSRFPRPTPPAGRSPSAASTSSSMPRRSRSSNAAASLRATCARAWTRARRAAIPEVRGPLA